MNRVSHIRIGNDLIVKWDIFISTENSAEPYPLEGKKLTLYLESTYGDRQISDFTINGNQIMWTFWGKEQRNTGRFSLCLIENEGEQNMHTIDSCDAFVLVVNSNSAFCEESGRIKVETITLTSFVSTGIPGPAGLSAYEIACLNGFVGTIDEWLMSLHGKSFTYDDFTQDQIEALQKPATDAAQRVSVTLEAFKKYEEQFSQNEDGRKTSEEARMVNERLRTEREAQRDINELRRTKSEEERERNENFRKSEEQSRKANEATRVLNELERGQAEVLRSEAENERNTAEELRVSAETARGIAENERNAAETQRATAENQRQVDTSKAISKTEEATANANKAVAEIDAKIAEKQNAIDDTLNTDNKEITGAINELFDDVNDVTEKTKTLEARYGHLGNATAGTLDVSELTKCHYPTVMLGHGVPSETNVPINLPAGYPWDGIPVFIGHQYIDLDATSGGLYYAIGVNSVSDWKQA